MARIVGRRPIELKIISAQNNYMPIFDGTTTVLITGDAIINSLSITGPNNNTSTYAVSLTGVGAYTIT